MPTPRKPSSTSRRPSASKAKPKPLRAPTAAQVTAERDRQSLAASLPRKGTLYMIDRGSKLPSVKVSMVSFAGNKKGGVDIYHLTGLISSLLKKRRGVFNGTDVMMFQSFQPRDEMADVISRLLYGQDGQINVLWL